MSRTVVDLIRHGEPVGGRKYRGQIDDPLSPKGWTQMRRAVGDHADWDVIVTSTLRRCSEFAEELAARHQLPLERDERLIEIGFGVWEGRTASELTATDPDVLRRFQADPLGHRPEGAEPLDAFRQRVVAAWEEVLQRHRGRRVLLVGHAGMMRAIVGHVLQVPHESFYRLQVANAGITRIEVELRGVELWPRLLFHGGSLA
jgi:alpha-ribazole phosphatase/probable phosphoglycerate mutase